MLSEGAAEEFDERRKFYRVKLKQSLIANMLILSIKGKDVALERTTEVLIQDISATGIRFFSYLELPVTDSILYKFETELMGKTYKLNGIIKRKREIRKDVFDYGVEFIISESDQERLIPVIFQLQRILRSNPLFSDGSFALENPITYLRRIKHYNESN